MLHHLIVPVLFIQFIFHWLPVHSTDDAFVISGYLPDYRSYININASSIYLSDLMLFSVTPDAVMSVDGCCVSSDHYELIRKAKSYKMEKQDEVLRLLITVGGAGRSDGFARITGGSLQVKRKFVDALIYLCKKEGLDGIDLDYEGIQSTEEWKAYLELMMFVADKLSQHSLLLTVALHPGQFLPKEVCQKINRVHVMTYDMIGGPGTKQGHHAELTAVQDSVKAFVRKGCSPSKVILGIPAYSRHGENPGLVKTYSEIVDGYLAEGKTIENDYFQQMAFMNGYYFDSPDDVRLKVNYAQSVGLGGIFLWELGQDKQYPGYDGGILLITAASAIGEKGQDEL